MKMFSFISLLAILLLFTSCKPATKYEIQYMDESGQLFKAKYTCHEGEIRTGQIFPAVRNHRTGEIRQTYWNGEGECWYYIYAGDRRYLPFGFEPEVICVVAFH